MHFTFSLPYGSQFSQTWNLGSSLDLRSQYLDKPLTLYWVTDGYSIHLPICGKLPSTLVKPKLFRNSACKVARTGSCHYTERHSRSRWKKLKILSVLRSFQYSRSALYCKERGNEGVWYQSCFNCIWVYDYMELQI